MNDEGASGLPGGADSTSASDKGAAWGVLGAANRQNANEYLDSQRALADLQMEQLKLQNDKLRKQDDYELSHLRFRRFSDLARFSLELAGFLIVVLIIGGLATLVWNAARDRDLVVDAFSVPPDVVQTGMTGTVLAGRVLDSFGVMENGTFTTQAANSYRSGGSQEVRVEIPETGISIGELNRYLREWLGHETHVSGDLVRAAKGFALTLRYGDAPGATLKGDDLERLIQQSAEHLFASLTPLRYGEYLMEHRRLPEASAVIVPLTASGGDKERALAYADWAQLLLQEGDYRGGLDKSREAVRLDPQNPTAMGWLEGAEGRLGHEEAQRAEALSDIPLWNGPDSDQFDPALVAVGPLAFAAYAAELEGDFASAVPHYAQASIVEPNWIYTSNIAIDLAQAHDVSRATRLLETIPAKAPDGSDNREYLMVRYSIARARHDWKSALAPGLALEKIYRSLPGAKSRLAIFAWPQIAFAEAMNGDLPDARAMIAKTPFDCDDCMRTRARIAGMSGDVPGMARMFAIVAVRSSHIPFAETDWGEMLLRKGDYDGAITKFATAHAKGPHFADPLEMWGEALMQKNRSDLALAKFEEANKYVPNWGRLHLKWGEALMYTGKRDEAQKQFAVASHLDLSAADSAALVRARANLP